MKPPVFIQQLTQASGPDLLLEDKCLFRVGISVTFCLTESPQSRSAKHEQPSRNKMFTVIKCFLFHEFRRYLLVKIQHIFLEIGIPKTGRNIKNG